MGPNEAKSGSTYVKHTIRLIVCLTYLKMIYLDNTRKRSAKCLLILSAKVFSQSRNSEFRVFSIVHLRSQGTVSQFIN